MRALRRRAMQWLCVVLLLGSQAPVGDQALASTARPITPVEVKPQLASIPNRLVSPAGVSDEGPWDNNFGIPGINGTVFAIAVTGTAVYIGGFFVTAGGVAANSIARWDRETNTWEALGNNLLGGGVGVNGVVSAIAVYGDDVYVGGGFDAVDGLSARSVAKWNDVTKQWSPMSGFPYPVDEIAVDSHGAVYVAGSVYVSNFPAPFACIQRWVGHAWTTGCRLRIELRPNEVAPFYGFRITALAVDKSDNVYVGGPASQIIDNVHMDGLAVWHGTWFPVPNREPNEVIDLAANGDEVYVLERLFSQPVNPYIDRLSTVAGGWSVLANFVPGGNSVIKSIAVSDAGNGADVYMGGRLTSINGVAVSNIAKWNSTTGQLSALATGIESNSPYIPVQALAIGEDAVYAGGDFTIAGGSTSNSIARWGRPTSLTVDTESNTQDGDTASVGALIANRGADGRISLPEAVTAVNNSNPGRTIKFDLPHGATIVLTETITLEASKTTIDGDVNGDAKPDVLIVGQAITPTLRVQSANNLIRNLAIKGLRLEGASAHDNRIANSYFGTDADGLAARPESGNGLEVASGASNNVIKNSIFAGNVNADPNINGAGLLIASGAHHNVVQGNRFGVNRVDAALPNEIGLAIVSGAQNNTIGGDWASTGCKDPCNLISGNQTVGLVLQGPGTMSNTVLGNLIGLNPAGSGPLPNEGSGIRLEAGASDNLIGGDHALKTCTGPCNVISGNQGAGVAIVGASQNRVQGNFIGLNLVGTGTLPNTASGVQVTGGAAFNIIGGLRTDNQCIGPCNLIGGNGQSGVVLEQTDTISNVVEGNYIGLGLTTIGFITMPNQLNGVTVAGGASLNLIGGIRPGEADCNGACNVISGNGGAGVLLADAGTTQNSVQGNFIGVNATRNVHMPNALSGVIANAATDNLIGGPRVPGACIGPCNVIAGNLGGGVWVVGQTTRGITIRGNAIYENGGVGIDLGGVITPAARTGDGVTLNDASDADAGSNDLLNAPMSLAADSEGTNTYITGIVKADTLDLSAIKIDIYGGYDARLNPGEAREYLGETTVGADGTFTLTVTDSLPPFATLSATATDAFGNTSEFSLKTPVIFVPGTGSSTLFDRVSGDELWVGLQSMIAKCLPLFPYVQACQDAFRSRLSLRSGEVAHTDVIATDAIREVLIPPNVVAKEFYGPFLSGLVNIGGYREYKVDGNPSRRTASGCDYERQKAEAPNLFVFAYDWRKSNIVNVELLKHYMDCVQLFYPGARINIVTHSMGSLLARRYILRYWPDHHVQRLITLAAPWIGAPKLLYVLETGDFVAPIASGAGIKYAIQSMPGAHELMPSRSWFTPRSWLPQGGPPPLIEQGLDYDGNGVYGDIFSDYDRLVNALDRKRYSEFMPGQTNSIFHDYARPFVGDQDFDALDATGVRYFHLYGIQISTETKVQVIAKITLVCLPVPPLPAPNWTCLSKPVFEPVYGAGDGTVPALSLSPWGYGTYETNDVPRRQVIRFLSPGPDDDTLLQHDQFPNYPPVLVKVVDLLFHSEPLYALATASTPSEASRALDAQAIFYKFTLSGTSEVVINDGLNSTVPISNTDLLGAVPGVSQSTLGERIEQFIMPTGMYSGTASGGEGNPPPSPRTYYITFRTTNEPLALEAILGTDDGAIQATRYQDLAVPPDVTATLTLSPEGPESLIYDANGDGTYDTTIAPTFSRSDADASDNTAPVITFQTTHVLTPTLTINLSAQDNGSRVRRLLYSLDGTHFQPYTGPFQANMITSPTLYAFADDNAVNRGVAVYSLANTVDQQHKIFLPLIGWVR